MPEARSVRAVLAMLTTVVVVAGLGACASPPSGPIRRLDPDALARIGASRPAAPLSLDEIIARSASTPPELLVDIIRTSGTRHALSPSDARRLREKGVAEAVIAALDDAQQRWMQDQVAAERVRRAEAAAAAEDRARAEALRRSYVQPYPYPYPYVPPYPDPGFGAGVLIRR